jgi:hypothetical protein
METNIRLLDLALEKDELYEFIIGKGEYYMAERLAEMPTSISMVFLSIQKYYQTTLNRDIWLLFEKAIIKLCEDPSHIWLVPYYIVSCLSFEKETGVTTIDFGKISKLFSINIENFKMGLSLNKNWQGWMWENGLMGDVDRMRKNLNEFYNFIL